MTRRDKKSGGACRIAGSAGSQPIRDLTTLEHIAKGMDPWQAAQIDSAFRDGEDWGPSLDHLVINRKNPRPTLIRSKPAPN